MNLGDEHPSSPAILNHFELHQAGRLAGRRRTQSPPGSRGSCRRGRKDRAPKPRNFRSWDSCGSLRPAMISLVPIFVAGLFVVGCSFPLRLRSLEITRGCLSWHHGDMFRCKVKDACPLEIRVTMSNYKMIYHDSDILVGEACKRADLLDEGLATLGWRAVRIGEQLFEMDADDYIDHPTVPWTIRPKKLQK